MESPMRTSNLSYLATICLCVCSVGAFAQTSPVSASVEARVNGGAASPQVESAPAPVPAHPVSETASQAAMDGAPQIAIGPGDLLAIDVFDTPELSGSSRVNQQGYVNLTVLGTIHVAGMTASEAARAIETALKTHEIMNDPHVTVSISEYATQGATVSGEVHNPGLYPTLGRRRLLELIAMAGGVTQAAGRTATIIHRNDPQHPVNISLVPNNVRLPEQANPVILPGDTIIIDRAGIIYILGAVNKPGGYLVDNNEQLSLLQAVSLSGGWLQTASLRGARLIRKVPEGREEVKIDLKRVTYGKQADIKIHNGDILFVPQSIGKVIAYQGLQEIVIGAEQAAVYQAYQ